MEIIELKSLLTKLKTFLEVFKSKFKMSKEHIRELEKRSI